MNTKMLRQLLNGYDYPEDPIRCVECGTPLRDGARCGLVARHPDDTAHWTVTSVYCTEDTPTRVPTSPTAEVALATADVASIVRTAEQRHTPCFVNVGIVDTDHGLAVEEMTA